MSLPAAAAPLAVLVLAWDETTPAARVLVEPTDFPAPALDSVAVLIPTDPPGDTLTQEEFLPLPAGPAQALPTPALPSEASAGPASPETSGPEAETAAPTEAKEAADSQQNIRTSEEAVDSEAAVAGAVATDALPEVALLAAADTNAPPLPAAGAITAAALVGPALVWQQVRVLHFASPARPTLVWEGSADAPAAPYLGGSVAAVAASEAGSPAAAALLAGAGSVASALGALHGPALPGGGPAPAFAAGLAGAPPPAYLLAELPAAPDAESDATPAPGTDESVLTPDASTTELSEAAAGPAASLTVDASAAQAELAQPIAPAGITEAAETTPPAAETPILAAAELAAPATSNLHALHPAGQPFNAPDLNFQIIQYARQAVPQALAGQPFGVIYAPAWPTWLAAQELRHRSGQPLVLHLAQLAAADDELIDLAAGWVAEIQRQALHRADLILTETPALAQRLRHELSLPAYRVRAVPAADAAAVALALRGVVRG